MNKRKIGSIVASILLILAMISYGLARHIGIIGPIFKVTSPDSRFFNPDNFKFNDYGSFKSRENAVRKLFPVRTPKEFVDRVLLASANGSVLQSKKYPYIWLYYPPDVFGFSRPHFIFIFDKNYKVLNIRCAATHHYLHPNQTTLDDVRK